MWLLSRKSPSLSLLVKSNQHMQQSTKKWMQMLNWDWSRFQYCFRICFHWPTRIPIIVFICRLLLDDSIAIVLYISFPFSLTKYSAIFAEVKGYFGIDGCNNQLAGMVWSCLRSLRFRWVEQNELNNQLGFGTVVNNLRYVCLLKRIVANVIDSEFLILIDLITNTFAIINAFFQ